MSTEKLIEGRLAALLARRVWTEQPTAWLHYDAATDALVVELVEAEPVVAIEVQDRLLVELDGAGPDALPVTVTLTGLRCAPDAPEVAVARELLGDHLWSAVEELVADAGTSTEVRLDAYDIAVLRAARRRLPQPVRWFGVEVVPGRVHAVLTDDAATVLDEMAVDTEHDDVATVVAAITATVRTLELRNPSAAIAAAPVSVQLGGPVDTAEGRVVFYDKPFHDSDEAWKDQPLAARVARATGHQALVFNDAWAFAALEAQAGLGRERAKVVVLVVRQGIGAKLVLRGVVAADFPMELGMVVVGDAGEQDPSAPRSIEAGSGVRAIIDAVTATGHPCVTIHDAGAAADSSPAALRAFDRAGGRLAYGMAAVQATLNPDAWVVVGPDALVDDKQRSAQAFLAALHRTGNRTGWGGLLPAQIVPRSTTGTLGARAAVVAAISHEGSAAALRRGEGDG